MTVEDTVFRAALRHAGLPQPEAEVTVVEGRRFRFDYCWPGAKLAMEVDGGLFLKGGGRHNRGPSMLRDFEKQNLAAIAGYRLLRVTPQQLPTPKVMEWVRRALAL